MAFSGALVCARKADQQTLTDLNDYLGPSQACIKPVEAPAPSVSDAHESNIVMEEGGVYVEAPVHAPRARTQLETAQISLNDCLACSGCVTSAESVLIGVQSMDEVRHELANKGERIFVATISAQTLASLQARFEMPRDAVWKRVSRALRHLGFDVVQDISLARHMSLCETVREFGARRAKRASGDEDAHKALPMLASACPGWVCYVEKAHGELLPYVSTTKSPQQFAGVLAKRVWGPQCRGQESANENASYVYHVAVMPCYDKKLEAVRQSEEQVRDVDCVLTTGELHDLIKDLDAQAIDTSSASDELLSPLMPEPGTSSGGYLFAILLDLYKQWVAEHPDEPPRVALHTIRSSDYTEYTLRAPDDSILFKGATCYGFRNIQNLVRKVQRETGVRSGRVARGRGAAMRGGRARSAMARSTRNADDDHPYDYVEVMACPGGCVNGGGQLRPPPEWEHESVQNVPTGQGWQGTDRRWVQHVERVYWMEDKQRNVSVDTAPAMLDDATHGAMRMWLDTWDVRANDMLSKIPITAKHATYHAVAPKTEGLSVQW